MAFNLNNYGTQKFIDSKTSIESDWLFPNWRVQTFQPIILIYKRGNFVYYNWEYKQRKEMSGRHFCPQRENNNKM